jgi:TRAP-type mannitol/chloroaromatic compound transport system permease large subunit
MSDPALGLLMLALIVVVIMMGFPTAFTLMGLGMFFGFIAFYDPTHLFTDNKVFELMVQRTYGAMTNDVLISIPLFVLMGYVMERTGRQDVLLDPARVPESAGITCRRDAHRVHLLGHRVGAGGRGGRADGRHRL